VNPLRCAGAVLAAALTACFGAGGCGEPAEIPPNVLLISIDSIRQDAVGAYGDPHGVTPTLDALAASGVLCTNAVSTTSWTLPAHMSLLTGQYPASHGVIGDGGSLPAEKVTLAEILREHGYRTGGFVSGPYLHRGYGFAQGFDLYEHCMDYEVAVREDGRVANVVRANLRSYRGVTSPLVHQAVTEWLRSIPRSCPFFLFVHYWDPHYDYEPPPPFDRLLDPAYAGRFDPEGFLQNKKINPGMSAADRKRLLDLYRGEIRYTDTWIRRLLRELQAQDALERTWIVVVGDHGEEFFEHGQKGHRNNLFEETLRSPVLLRLGSIFAGGAILTQPVSLVDVVPTVLTGLGFAPLTQVQGAPLQDVRVSGEERRPGVFAELYRRLLALRGDRWKTIVDLESGAVSLYDMWDDPGERRDVSGEQRDVAREQLELLRSGEHARHAPADLETPVLDEETEAALRALGYTD
jgi:arylsulfatase A-like enzyme